MSDYEIALRELRPLAEQGKALAQSNLGLMYEFGQGVPKDFICAHMWFNLSAAGGAIYAKEARDSIAKEMATAQIEKAQALAKECLRKEYKDC